MMRITAAILFLALAACARDGRAQGTIFRHIVIGTDTRIELGKPISPDAKAMLVRSGDGAYQVRPGMFGGARSISVYTRPDGTVRCMEFGYSPGVASFAYHLAEYEHDLGAPAMRDGTPSSEHQVTEWHDARTAFVLTRIGQQVSSMLCEPVRIENPGRPGASVGPVRTAPAPE